MPISPLRIIHLNSALAKSFLFFCLVINLTAGYAQKTAENKPVEAYTQAIKNGDKLLQAGDYLHALNAYQKALNLSPAQKYPLEKIALIEKALADSQLSNTLFEASITNGEKFLAAKDYRNARTEYLNAVRLDPEAQYPKDRLAEISKVFTDPEMEALLNGAVKSAEMAFSRAEYDEAIRFYRQALAIKPGDKSLISRIADAERLKTELAAKKEAYHKSISVADNLLEQKNYTSARTEYAKALAMFPGENYPEGKIAFIDKVLADNKAGNDAYAAVIEEADKLYIARDFDNARIRYRQALNMRPGERYPKSMLEKADMGQSEVRTIRQRYDDAITNADKLFKASEMDAALIGYQSASGILPDETYPKTKIAEINKTVNEFKSMQDAYAIAIANGDQAYEAAAYSKALAEYKNALSLQLNENYPKTRIAAIEALLLKEKNLQDSFNKAISSADKELEAKKYTEAIATYQTALSFKPAEKYSMDKIAEINAILNNQKSSQEKYEKAIAAADQVLGEKNYALALTGYQSALALKPAESYPKEKITEINTLLGRQKAIQDSYDKAIAAADKDFDAKKYPEAVAGYEAAIALKASEKYPQDKITEISTVLINEKANYDRANAAADQALGEKNYALALTGYQAALALKPAESYPKEKITEINILLGRQKTIQDSYDKAIAAADKDFDSKKYPEAVAGYEAAIALKASEKYPQDKITEISTVLINEKANYDRANAAADQALGEKNYALALTGYQAALALKPAESYPKEKITEINILLGRQKTIQDSYDKAIAAADKDFDSKKYPEAVAGYQAAIALKVSEKYPQDKITEINSILDKQKSLQENYDKAIAAADKDFGIKKYPEAIVGYQSALGLKPSETYPREKITEIDGILGQQKAIAENYEKSIASADKALGEKNYTIALNSYQAALTSKPTEAYPLQKIDEINSILSKQKALQESYDIAIASADKAFDEKKYTDATTGYRSALGIKPAESYPQDKIAEINVLQAKQNALNESYSKAIASADKALAGKDYLLALSSYQSALVLKPEETYAQEKINAINAVLAVDKERTDQRFTELISKADAEFAKQNYTDARTLYQQASSVKAGETYPKDKLTEISNLLLARAKEMKDAYDRIIADADKAYTARIYDQAVDAYENAREAKPDESYPGEMIAKIRKYMAEHSIVNVTKETFLVLKNTEKRYSFKPVNAGQRKNNYVVLKARNPGGSKPKVYLNYGRDNAKNGGIVLRSITSDANSDFIIRISVQDKWYREDNNWLSLYSEGGDIEVSSIQIAQGD